MFTTSQQTPHKQINLLLTLKRTHDVLTWCERGGGGEGGIYSYTFNLDNVNLLLYSLKENLKSTVHGTLHNRSREEIKLKIKLNRAFI